MRSSLHKSNLVARLDKIVELEDTFGAAFQIAFEHWRNRRGLNMKHISTAMAA